MKALFTGQSPATRYASIDPTVIAGTSAGALNASLLLSVAGEPLTVAVKYIEDVWLNAIADGPDKCGNGVFKFRVNVLDFFNPACYQAGPLAPLIELTAGSAYLTGDLVKRGIQFITSPLDLQQRALEIINVSAFASVDRFVCLLHDTVHLDAIRASQRKVRIAATNWRTGALRVFANEDMTDDVGHKIIQASSSIPGLFPRVEIGNDPYVDGGLVMNTPLKPAIDAGAESLHIIYIDPDAAHVPLPRLDNTTHDLYRSLLIGFAAALKRDLEVANRVNLALATAGTSRGGVLTAAREDKSLVASTLEVGVDGEPHRHLHMHLHHPNGTLEGGWLTFERSRVENLITQGFEDAVRHDCIVNGCLLSEQA
jgi:predicted acylesterase/phospholipase RssA